MVIMLMGDKNGVGPTVEEFVVLEHGQRNSAVNVLVNRSRGSYVRSIFN